MKFKYDKGRLISYRFIDITQENTSYFELIYFFKSFGLKNK